MLKKKDFHCYNQLSHPWRGDKRIYGYLRRTLSFISSPKLVQRSYSIRKDGYRAAPFVLTRCGSIN